MYYLKRYQTDGNGTFGRFFSDDTQLCFTIERPTIGDHPCIPPGTYSVEDYLSPAHGDVWEVMNVPGRTAIEIHPANLSSQLLGCIAPGMTVGELNGTPAVLSSLKAFTMLKNQLPDKFTLIITEEFS